MSRMLELRTRPEVAAFFDEAHALAITEPSAFRAYVDRARWTPDLPNSAWDPHGPEYRAWVMERYRDATGHEYGVANEAHAFDEAILTQKPYPYNTGLAQEVGMQLVAIGTVIQAINARPGEQVLEMGIGWGNLAIQMARYGVDIEAIDIEPKFQRLVAIQADRAHVRVPVHVEEFLSGLQRRPDASYDVVLFFEAFHHSPDHLALMQEARRVLKPGGRLVLAGEAIEPNLEYPWGLNPSGIAVYSIALHGWLELALREDYLMDCFSRAGFATEKIMGPNAAGICYIGR